MNHRAVLLDTHALIWAFAAPDRLGADVRSLIGDAAVNVLVSAASAWEISVKFRSGKLPGVRPLVTEWTSHVRRLGVSEIAVTSDHALLAGTLDWSHRDPFDRILVAQAIREGVPLATCDAAMRSGDAPAALEVIW